MRPGAHVLFGVFLVLAASPLTGSAGGQRRTRRITAADLPPASNSSATSNCTNGSCGAPLQEEAKGKAKGKLSELPSSDARDVVQPVTHEVLQERLHSDIVRDLATTPHYSSYEGPYYQDGVPIDAEPSSPQEGVDLSYGHHGVGTEANDFNSSLTTPRVELFDERYARVSESIRQHLEELDEQQAFRSTDGPSSEPTTGQAPRSAAPTTGDLALRNGSKVALEYTNHVSIQYNDTSDPPRSVRKDIVVENGTRMDFTSSYIHTEEFPEATPTFATAVQGRRGESNGHSNGHTPATAAEEQVGSTHVPEQTPDNRVTPGEIHSTTSKPASDKSSSGSQRYNSTTEDDSVDMSSDELSTVIPKLNKVRYVTRRVKLGGVPTAGPSSAEDSSASAGRNGVRASRRRPQNTTSDESESSTPLRSAGRMFTSRRNQANATNSLAESPTMVPLASISEAPRKKQTTQYVPRRAVVNATARDELDRTEIPMVRMKVSTVRPSSTTTVNIKRNLVQDRRFEGRTTTEWGRPGTTQSTVPLKASNAKRHRNIAEESAGTTVDTGDNAIRSRPPMLRRPSSSAAPNTEGNDIVAKSPAKPARGRGTVRYGNSTRTLNIPPTAAAWALASLRAPLENNRVVRRPADNDTAAEDGAESLETNTTMKAMEELVAIEVTTSPKPLQFSLESVTAAPTQNSSTPSGILTSASMQENKIFSVHVQPLQNSSGEATTAPSEELTSTMEPVTSTTEDSTMGTTTMTTTTVDDTTVAPATDSPTEATTGAVTTETVPRPSTTTVPPTDDARTTTTDLPETSTTAHSAGVPDVTSTVSEAEVDEEKEESTTEPPTTTAEPAVGSDFDLAQEQPEDERSNSNETETEAPPPMEPAVTTVNSSSETTTMRPDDTVNQDTTTDAADTTPAVSSESWLPASEEVTAYLRVSVRTSWRQLCAQKEEFRAAVAGLLASRTGRNISTEDVILANVGSSQCADVVTSGDDVTKVIVINMYILNENGAFDKKLNEDFPDLWAQTEFPIPLEIQQVDLMRGPLPSTSDAGNAGVIAAITISCVGALCLLLLAALLIVMRKRQKRFNYGQRCTPVSLDAYSLDSVSVYNSVRRKGIFRASKRSYGNPAFDDPGAPSHPMNFAGLANFSSDRAALEEEFGLVPQVTPKAEELPEGAETKNRYSNVVPLPETRVPLALVDGEPLSDYINANYVKGPKNENNFYIACQAPLPSTITDFWRMVWEQQSKVILMLTDLVENGVEKCADYLPPSEVLDCHRLFGDYQITLKKREEREKYVISTLQLKNLETNTWREVTHLWYLSWPHQGVPEEANSIIAFLIEARTYMRANQGPNIVHCSPGTGRTGTVLACDVCIREFEQTRMVDIPRSVYRLRRDRGGAVKTRDQYVFIYQVLNTYATKLTGGGMDSI